MDPVLSGVFGTFLVFILLSLGMPIAFSMMLVGFLGISLLTSVDAALPLSLIHISEPTRPRLVSRMPSYA